MDILLLLEELQTIARNGLTYAENPYDRERYQRLLDLACTSYGQVLDLPAPDVRQRLAAELGQITPKVGADAVIFDAEGRVLLGQRADNQRWGLPCGWVDPGESPAEAAIREVREETGLDVRILQLVDVQTRLPSVEYGLYTLVAVIYLCEVIGGDMRTSHESLDLRYWSIDDVPIWHSHHHHYTQMAQAVWKMRQTAYH